MYKPINGPGVLRKAARTNYLDHCFNLHIEKYPLPADILSALEQNGYLGERKSFDSTAKSMTAHKVFRKKKKYLRGTLDKKNQNEIEADANTIVIDATKVKVDINNLSIESLKNTGAVVYDQKITTADWKIEKRFLMEHDAQFYDWINSINRDFREKIPYWRLEIYKAQAKEWLSNKSSINDFSHEGDQINWLNKEIDKCEQNSLYFLNKYWKYRDISNIPGGGFSSYIAYEAQAIIAFMVDSGYNFFLAKARQIFATTTIFGINVKRAIVRKSYFGKMVTADLKKAEQTFSDKLKDPYYALSGIMKPSKPSTDGKLYITWYKDKKEQVGGESKITIENATVGAVNSGEPSWFQVDEAGMTDCLTGMINEWQPTCMQLNPETGFMEYKNQITVWGTSFIEKDGQMVDQSPEFEYQFRNAILMFEKKKFRGNLIPLFFNCFGRPGMTEELYEELKDNAYSKEGPLAEYERIRFHKSYPITIDDMFMSNPQTLIPKKEIDAHLKRINALPIKEQYGYFTPIYAETKIIGANWNPVDDSSDFRAACFINRFPVPGWEDRYFKGSDPINNRSGHSNFGSTIWDQLDCTISAGMAWRPEDHRDSYKQSFLLGLFYSPNILDLIESNAGQGYIDYLDEIDYGHMILPNIALPKELQTPNGNWAGINNKSNTRWRVITELANMLDLYGGNINTYRLFLELRTFIRKKTTNSDRYEVNDERFNFDDFILCTAFAYICAKANQYILPRNIFDSQTIKKPTSRLIMNPATYTFERVRG